VARFCLKYQQQNATPDQCRLQSILYQARHGTERQLAELQVLKRFYSACSSWRRDSPSEVVVDDCGHGEGSATGIETVS